MESVRRDGISASGQAPLKLTSDPQGMSKARNFNGISPNRQIAAEADSDSDAPLSSLKRRRTQRKGSMEDHELMSTGPADWTQAKSSDQSNSNVKPTHTPKMTLATAMMQIAEEKLKVYAGPNTTELETLYLQWEENGKPHDGICVICVNISRPTDLACLTCRRDFHLSCLKPAVTVGHTNGTFFCPLCTKRTWSAMPPSRQSDSDKRQLVLASHIQKVGAVTWNKWTDWTDTGSAINDHELLLNMNATTEQAPEATKEVIEVLRLIQQHANTSLTAMSKPAITLAIPPPVEVSEELSPSTPRLNTASTSRKLRSRIREPSLSSRLHTPQSWSAEQPREGTKRKRNPPRYTDDGILRGDVAINALRQGESTLASQVSSGEELAQPVARPRTPRQEHARGVARPTSSSKTKTTSSPLSAMPTTKAPRPSNRDIPSSPQLANTTPQKISTRSEPFITPSGPAHGSPYQRHEPLGSRSHLTDHQPTPSRAGNITIRRRKVHDDESLFLPSHSKAMTSRPAIPTPSFGLTSSSPSVRRGYEVNQNTPELGRAFEPMLLSKSPSSPSPMPRQAPRAGKNSQLNQTRNFHSSGQPSKAQGQPKQKFRTLDN